MHFICVQVPWIIHVTIHLSCLHFVFHLEKTIEGNYWEMCDRASQN